jgi:hypothetical protein
VEHLAQARGDRLDDVVDDVLCVLERTRDDVAGVTGDVGDHEAAALGRRRSARAHRHRRLVLLGIDCF